MTYATCSRSRRPRLLRTLGLAALALVLPVTALPAASAPPPFTPGAAGVGDRYFPKDGNGGYDVRRYELDLDYSPAENRLSGVASVHARALKNLSRFDLDLDGLRVHRVSVNGHPAQWHRRDGELVIDPAGRGLRQGRRFLVVVRYAGVPETIHDAFGVSGVLHTDDGMTIAGQPHGAATWFPVNDHPTDKAAYTFRVSVPRGHQVVANGVLTGRRREGARTTWTWAAKAPMASYLATVNVGRFVLTRYRKNGIVFQDAIDPDLLEPPARPRSGQQFAISGRADSGYKRLTHRIDVPAGGASLSFWVDRDTERRWDFFFVEAHAVGTRSWTTLPDANGHTSPSTGNSCPGWLALHPFLKHYQTAKKDGTCAPHGSTGVWRAATGASRGYEHWSVGLDRYAGRTIEVSLTQASDDVLQMYGAFVDDIAAPGRQGSTSFEDDRDAMDGWTVAGPPRSSPGNTNDWTVGTVEDTPLPFGVRAQRSFQREPEILSFLSRRFGAYPFRVAGGIADDDRRLQFALETQTRPVYSLLFFTDQPGANGVVVHELAHQWYGDSVALQRWRDIWLNEGFATYAEWLWTEHVGGPAPRRTFRQTYRAIPGNDPFWDLRVGNPGRKGLFDNAVYLRGAMTLQRLRARVGDETFFRILRRWAATQAGGNVSTAQFIRFTERISGRDLDTLFHTWLFLPKKPRLPGVAGGERTTKAGQLPRSVVELLRR